MDNLRHGTRDKRGHWTPNEPLAAGPLLDGPWSAARPEMAARLPLAMERDVHGTCGDHATARYADDVGDRMGSFVTPH
jgi:hypothetical protein